MPNYTWNQKWKKSDESPFSLLNKFLYANAISTTHLIKMLTNDVVDFIYDIGILPSSLERMLLGRSSIEYLNYCPICIQHGYHSNSHQFLEYCHIHGARLVSTCRCCDHVFLSDRLTSRYYKAPYTCICGQEIVNNPDHQLLHLWYEQNYNTAGNFKINQTVVLEDRTLEFTHIIPANESIDILTTAYRVIRVFLKFFSNMEYLDRFSTLANLPKAI